ncbi:MAG: hypothetical protein WB783_05525 [Arenicellales bacterium]
MRKARAVLLAAVIAVLGAGCGGGSSSGGGADNGFTDNVSGKWSGTATSATAGSAPFMVSISQPVSNSNGDAQPFTGMFIVSGVGRPLSGTKQGNAISMTTTLASGAPAPVTVTFTGSLSDANTMSGKFGQSSGVTGSWQLKR